MTRAYTRHAPTIRMTHQVLLAMADCRAALDRAEGESMTEHTKGPWRSRIVNGGFGIRAGAEDQVHVALLYVGEKASLVKGEAHDTAEANARLIAWAPEMLETLAALTSLCVNEGGAVGFNVGNGRGQATVKEVIAVIDRARALLARIETAPRGRA